MANWGDEAHVSTARFNYYSFLPQPHTSLVLLEHSLEDDALELGNAVAEKRVANAHCCDQQKLAAG